MDSIEFVSNYEKYIAEISQVIKPDLIPVLDELKAIDPHDIVRPEGYFNSESHARGLVWSLFLKQIQKSSNLSFINND